MKKILVLIITLILSTSVFAADVDAIVKNSKYTPFLMMETGCDAEDVRKFIGILLVNMNLRMSDYMPTGKMSSMRYTNWPDEETAYFVDRFLYSLHLAWKYENENSISSYYLTAGALSVTIQAGVILIRTILPNVSEEVADTIICCAIDDTVDLF